MTTTSHKLSRARSRQWFDRAQQSLVEGVNSPSRGQATYSSGPIFLERGSASHVWDADGNEYVDFMMSFGALIHGHAHPKLVAVASEAMAEGSHFAAATSAEVEAAERFPSCGAVGRSRALHQHRQRSNYAGTPPGAGAHRPKQIPEV